MRHQHHHFLTSPRACTQVAEASASSGVEALPSTPMRWIKSPAWDLVWVLNALWLAPMVLLLARSHDHVRTSPVDGLFFALAVPLWFGHRVSSAWLAYATPAYRPLLATQRLRFVVAPLAVGLTQLNPEQPVGAGERPDRAGTRLAGHPATRARLRLRPAPARVTARASSRTLPGLVPKAWRPRFALRPPTAGVACLVCTAPTFAGPQPTHRMLGAGPTGASGPPFCNPTAPRGTVEFPIRCAQLWLSASELKAPDRLAACAAEVRAGPGFAMVQGTRTDPMHVLWGGDGDCENAHSVGVLRGYPGSAC